MFLRTRKRLTKSMKTVSLGVLYFVQGLPYGFQDKLIPLVLILQGHSASTVAITRLLMLPWLLAKPLFAPLVDTTFTKKKWVLVSLCSLAAICLLNVFIPESKQVNSISNQLFVTLFMLNLFSAIQDIAVDAIAIAILSNDNEVTSGNAAQIVGYKLGALFGSGLLFWIYSSFNWNGLFFALFLLYVTVVLIFLLSLASNLIEEDKSWSNFSRTFCNQKQFSKLLLSATDHSKWFQNIPSNLINLVIYLLLYKLGETAACSAFPFLMLKSGVSSHQIAFWNGTVAVICSIFGSTLASQLSLSQLSLVIKFRLVPLSIQLLLAFWSDWHADFQQNPLVHYLSIVSLLSLHFIGGITTTLTFSLMMSTCRKFPESFRATRYTLLSSVEVFGKLIFTSISGFLIDFIGFTRAYFFFWLISFMPLFPLFFVIQFIKNSK